MEQTDGRTDTLIAAVLNFPTLVAGLVCVM